MSVAFRRESDDDHKEPEFEIPIAIGPNWVTPRGLRLLGEEIARLESLIAAEDDIEARKKLQRQLRYFHTRHTTAEVQTTPLDGTVGVGSRVTFTLNGKERSLTIVGGDEADPGAGSIAFSAPVGRALMSGEANEMVEFQGIEDALHILTVEDDLEVRA